MTGAIYQIPGYPAVSRTRDGREITFRPMLPSDEEGLLAFFRRVSPEDRLYLKDDVTAPEVIAHWAERLDYRRVLPLLAIVDGTIIGDGTLHHNPAEARRHIGEVRVVIDPAFRNQGVGTGLLRRLINIASSEDRELEKVIFEVVSDTQTAAQHAAQSLGFAPVAVFSRHVRYYRGEPHDLIVMELQVGAGTADSGEDDPSMYMY
jgi:RimJ/RimL family protein N-acetyltransferase